MSSVWKRLQRVGKKAAKFQYVASYQELLVQCTHKWQPDKLRVVWIRRNRRHSTKLHSWQPGIQNPYRGQVVWQVPESVDIAVTLFKEPTAEEFEDKDWTVIIEDETKGRRKVLASLDVNMKTYASATQAQHQLTLKLRPLSVKVVEASLKLTLSCVFLKEGKATDEDMLSLASLMSLKQSDVGNLDDFNDSEEEGGEDRRAVFGGGTAAPVTDYDLPSRRIRDAAWRPVVEPGPSVPTSVARRPHSFHSDPCWAEGQGPHGRPSSFASSASGPPQAPALPPHPLVEAGGSAALTRPCSLPSAPDSGSWQSEWRPPKPQAPLAQPGLSPKFLKPGGLKTHPGGGKAASFPARQAKRAKPAAGSLLAGSFDFTHPTGSPGSASDPSSPDDLPSPSPLPSAPAPETLLPLAAVRPNLSPVSGPPVAPCSAFPSAPTARDLTALLLAGRSPDQTWVPGYAPSRRSEDAPAAPATCLAGPQTLLSAPHPQLPHISPNPPQLDLQAPASLVSPDNQDPEEYKRLLTTLAEEDNAYSVPTGADGVSDQRRDASGALERKLRGGAFGVEPVRISAGPESLVSLLPFNPCAPSAPGLCYLEMPKAEKVPVEINPTEAPLKVQELAPLHPGALEQSLDNPESWSISSVGESPDRQRSHLTKMTIQLGPSKPVQSKPNSASNTARPVQTTPQIGQSLETTPNQKQRIEVVQMPDVHMGDHTVPMDLG
ncbi:hypothetical protein NHX12_014050 [Muraenolepis orangiensis]|uniref:C2 NT-type domain-containing protein n=1 Tax=Muraenolepis orangiensis TaxID=630683 RepID=A0A9Q0DBF2_9TELE|nr:hypothetical protein NHX12_014050 [Muraenolepis orangiensis]